MLLLPRLVSAVVPALALLLTLGAAAQQEPTPGPPQRDPIDPELSTGLGPTGTIIVRIGFATGINVPYQIEVKLFSHMGFQQASALVKSDGQVAFNDIPLDEYTVEVKAPGFATTKDHAVLWKPGSTAHLFVNLRPASTDPIMRGPAGFPVLAPKVQKQADRGLRALRANNLAEAQQYFEHTLKAAPGHPYLNFLLGLVYFRQDKLGPARELLEKATKLAPDFSAGHEALAAVLSAQENYAGAIPVLERAIVLTPDRWELHWRIGIAYYQTNQFENARAHAERAKDLSKSEAAEPKLLLALALARLGQRDAAIRELEDFLNRHATHTDAPRARKVLEHIRQEAAEAATPPAIGSISLDVKARNGALLEVEQPEHRWAPPDVDEVVPPTEGNLVCPLPEVLKDAGSRVLALAKNMESISATERIDFAELDRSGYERSSGWVKFNYVVTILETRPGMLSVEESRQGGSEIIPSRMFTKGLAAMAIAFHPYYVNDFEMTCEGLGQWRGQPAWQVHFQQRSDRPNRILVYRSERGVFPIAQKGRAWISANTHEILRMETDLMQPMPEVGLERQHLAIEYGPVDFHQKTVQLWLPSTAVLHAQVRGRRIRHQHVFSDFLLFSVDTRQNIHAPQEPPQ